MARARVVFWCHAPAPSPHPAAYFFAEQGGRTMHAAQASLLTQIQFGQL